MDRHYRHGLAGIRPGRAAIAAALIVMLAPAATLAGGVRIGQKANPGDIVLIRDVATRPAYRMPLAPGMALIVNPTPQPQLNQALGLGNGSGELSDADEASLSASPSNGNTITRMVDGALGLNNANGRAGGATTNNGIGSPGNGTAGAIGNATGGIGAQVSGALSQLPMPGH